MKPKPPIPPLLRKILRKILSHSYYTSLIGRHEKTTLAIWEVLSSNLSSKSTVIDIGAYHGEFSIISRSSNTKVKIHAFEPNTISIKSLDKNISGLSIKTSNFAITDFCGEQAFLKSNATSRLMENNSVEQTIKVETITLDKYQELNKLKIELIKIDTEGNEYKILKGASNVLKKFKPTILCEVLNNELGKKLTKLLSQDYIFFHIDEKYKCITQRPSINRTLWRNRNWYLVPLIKKENFKELILNSKNIIFSVKK